MGRLLLVVAILGWRGWPDVADRSKWMPMIAAAVPGCFTGSQ